LGLRPLHAVSQAFAFYAFKKERIMSTPHTHSIVHSPAFLRSDETLAAFVSEWEICRLPASEWTHAAHIAAASYYAWTSGSGETYRKMRDGVLNFNASVGGKNTDTSGYHESLTRFWSFSLWRFVNARDFSTRIDAVRAAVAELASDRGFVDRHYGFDVRNSRQCRHEWRAPNDGFATELALFDSLCEAETVRDVVTRIHRTGLHEAVAIYGASNGEPVLYASAGDMNGRCIGRPPSDQFNVAPIFDAARTAAVATFALWSRRGCNGDAVSDMERARLYAAACRGLSITETR
jgi:hypothetical protein